MSNHGCPDCGGEFEAGFVPDFSQGQANRQSWHRGKPEDATFFGMKLGPNLVKYDREKMVPITAFRCVGCGLLKFYAVKDADE